MTYVLERFMVTFGGAGGDGTPMTKVGLLDLITKTWHQRPCGPSIPRTGHVAGFASGSLFIFGGSDGAAPAAAAHRHACDPARR